MNGRMFFIAAAVAAIAVIFSFQAASAHTTVHVGDYDVEIGWVDEPPVIGQRNAVVVNVSNTKSPDATVDISKLTVNVTYGGQTKTLTLQPLSEDTTNQYIAPILPMVAGQYTVQLRGQLDTTDISQDVTPEEVVSADTLEFPSGASAAAASTQAAASLNWSQWLSIVALIAALAALLLALRKTR